MSIFEHEQYLVTVRSVNNISRVCLLMKQDASTADILRGMATAHICSSLLDEERQYRAYNTLESATQIVMEHSKWFCDRYLSTRMDIVKKALGLVTAGRPPLCIVRCLL